MFQIKKMKCTDILKNILNDTVRKQDIRELLWQDVKFLFLSTYLYLCLYRKKKNPKHQIKIKKR